MRKYAQGTTVTLAETIADIEQELTRFQAVFTGYAVRRGTLEIEFDDPEGFPYRVVMQTDGEKPQEINRKARSLYAVIKAQLIAVHDGIFTFQQAFMPALVLPDNRRLGEVMQAKITEVYPLKALPPGEENPTDA